MKLLEEKNAIIIGAKGGIGKSVAKQFIAHGANVFLSDINVEGEFEESEIGQIRKLDALNETEVNQYFQWFLNENVSIDVVINLCGSDPSTHKHGLPAVDSTLADFMSPLKGSLASQFLTAKEGYKVMREQKNGVIIFFSSTLSMVGCPWCPGLTAAHSGVEGLMRSLANEWGPEGIRVLGVRSEAMTDTPTIDYTYKAMGSNIGLDYDGMKDFIVQKTALKRLTDSMEMAKVIVFAASDLASYMAGTTLNHSGGHVMD